MKISIALLAILVALAVLNPEMQDFRNFVETKLGDKLTAESGSGTVGKMGAGAIALLAEQVSERKNYFLFSTFTVDLDGPERKDNDWQFLGIGGTFFQLREPERRSSKKSVTG